MKGHKVLVTGAASGIGRSVSLVLADRGAQLALLDINGAVKDVAGDTGSEAFLVDLADTDPLPEVVTSAARVMDGLSGIVNCAGCPSVTPLVTLEGSEWQRILAVDLTAPT